MLKQKDIDLLRVYEKRNQPVRYRPWMKYAIAPSAIVLVLLLVFSFLIYQNHQTDQEIAQLEAEIAALEKEQNQGGKQEKFAQLQTLRENWNQMDTMLTHMNSYPDLGSHVINGVFDAVGSYVSISGITYNQMKGALELKVNTPYVTQSDKVIRRLKETQLFEQVRYQGYTSDREAVEEPPVQSEPQDFSDLSDDEVRNAIVKKLLEDEQQSQQKQVTKEKNGTLRYHLTIECVLKKAVKEQ